MRDDVDRRTEAGPASASLRNTFVQLLKFAVAFGVIFYLISRGDISWEPLRAALGEWRYSIPAFLILAITPFGQFWRWQKLLRSAGLYLPHRDVFSYLMVSKFFNMAFPSYVSGDILRGFYIFRRAAAEDRAVERGQSWKAAPPAVLASIIFDRAAGLLPLFVFSFAGLAGSRWYPISAQLVSLLAVVALAGIGMLAVLFVLAWQLPQPPELLLRIFRKFGAADLLSSLHAVAHDYVRDGRLIGSIIGISFLTQAAGIVSFALFGRALDVHIPFSAYLALVPLGLMVTAIPIAPAGLGVGHVAFLSLFHMVGISQGANLYTLYMASYVVINLSGAFLYLTSRMAPPLPQSVNTGNFESD